jgi:hypothetical protein
MKFTIRKASSYGYVCPVTPPHNSAVFNKKEQEWEIEIKTLEQLEIFMTDLNQQIILTPPSKYTYFKTILLIYDDYIE